MFPLWLDVVFFWCSFEVKYIMMQTIDVKHYITILYPSIQFVWFIHSFRVPLWLSLLPQSLSMPDWFVSVVGTCQSSPLNNQSTHVHVTLNSAARLMLRIEILLCKSLHGWMKTLMEYCFLDASQFSRERFCPDAENSLIINWLWWDNFVRLLTAEPVWW